jgi:hypothetical protein
MKITRKQRPEEGGRKMKITLCKEWLATFSGLSESFQGWFAGLYYWIYPGVMAAGITNELIRRI